MSLEGTFVHDKLLGGSNVRPVTGEVTVLLGAGPLVRGTVLGLVEAGALSQGFVGTGNGVLSGLAAGPAVKVGAYKARLITVVTNGGRFAVEDPDGLVIGEAVVGTAFVDAQIGFTIADGATDFVLGDVFTLTVAAGSKKAVKVDSSALDGRDNPFAILAEDVAANPGADVTHVPVYFSGQFNEEALVFGGTDTIATHRAALRNLNIHARTSVAS